MVNVDSYLRIYRWRGLTGKILIEGQPDPHETAVALIQLAALTRTHASINEAIPLPLYRVLREQVDDRGITCGDMSDPIARGLFLSDLHDFLRLFKRIETIKCGTQQSPLPPGEPPNGDKG
jgi:hypothetical protein